MSSTGGARIAAQQVAKGCDVGRAARNRRGASHAVAGLTVYLVLLFAIPSNVRIGALGSLGYPAFLWGLGLLSWWVIWRLQLHPGEASAVRQPVRAAFLALLAIALVSLAAALLRGQPADQVSPLFTSILRLLSWAGVLLVAMDGIADARELATVVRRIGLGGALLAAFGLLQFVIGRSMLEWWGTVPGFTQVVGGVAERGSFTRPSGTATHPLEHATVLCAALPLLVGSAVNTSAAGSKLLSRLLAWLPVAVVCLGAILSVSRSAIIGLGVALVLTIPALPKVYRRFVIVAGVILAGLTLAAVPGLLGTFLALFAIGGDASTQSRSDALNRLPEFVSPSPLIGSGFGSFLPRYYIFDNAWALMLVELGCLGLVAFGMLFATALLSARGAVRTSRSGVLKIQGRTLWSSVGTIAIVFLFFDGLAFPQAAGIAFLLVGLCAAIHRIAREGIVGLPCGVDNGVPQPQGLPRSVNIR